MNKNMRKMYTEEEVKNIIKSVFQGGTLLYRHNVTIIDNTDVDNPITTHLTITSYLPLAIDSVPKLYSNIVPQNFIKGTVENQPMSIILQFVMGTRTLVYFDCDDVETKTIVLGQPDKLTITDIVDIMSNYNPL